MKKKTMCLFATALFLFTGTTVFADTVPHSDKKVMKYADVYGRDNLYTTATSQGYWTGPSKHSLTTIQITNSSHQVKQSGAVSSNKVRATVTWNVNNKTTTHYHTANDHVE